MKRSWLIWSSAALLSLLAACQQEEQVMPYQPEQGVPRVDPDYSLSVAEWWARHPLNPEARGGIPIGGIAPFANVVTVRPGDDVQAIIDKYQDQGVTIRLEPGTYYWPLVHTHPTDPTARFSLVTRGYSNIQLVADEPGTVVVKGRILISGIQFAIPKGSKDPQVRTYDESSLCKASYYHPYHSECLEVLRNLPGNVYIKNITFDGDDEFIAPLVNVRSARDVVLDNVTFRNHRIDPDSHHAGQLEAASAVNNVWVRGGRFLEAAPSAPYSIATYMDGLHGGGVIYSDMAGTKSTSNLFLTNDDFTEDTDLPRNGIQPDEYRNGRYLVLTHNTYPSINTAIAMTAADSLVEANEVPGLVNHFVALNPMCSRRFPEEVGHYPQIRHLIQGNAIGELDDVVTIEAVVDTFKVCLPTAGVGQVRIENNRLGRLREVAVRIVLPSQEELERAGVSYSQSQIEGVIAKPNEVSNNCVGDGCK